MRMEMGIQPTIPIYNHSSTGVVSNVNKGGACD